MNLQKLPLKNRPADKYGQNRSPVRQPGQHLLEDIDALFSHAHDLQGTLQEITKIITQRMGTDVCSLYLLDSKEERLTLWATTGLDQTAIGKVSLQA